MSDGCSFKPAQILVFTSLAALLLTLSLDNWTGDSISIIRWLVQVIPLLLFILPLLKSGLRAYQWLCFVILLYFLMGIQYLFSPIKQMSGIAITFFSVLLFCSNIFYIHKEQKLNATVRY
jgi:uncharacterized membrane protein